jgi:hypothetical protein
VPCNHRPPTSIRYPHRWPNLLPLTGLADPPLRPAPDNSNHPWIDDTLIPVHDQSITTISTNYRRSVNTETIICGHRRRVVVAGNCWPGHRNGVIVARHTAAHLCSVAATFSATVGTEAPRSLPRDATH